MNLNPVTVATALPIVARKLGLDPVHNRDEVLTYLNRIRSLWYHSFHRRRLFDDLQECVPVMELTMDCVDCCCDKYLGFSIPSYMSGPVTAWAGKSRVILRSRWREKHTGRDTYAPGVDMVELPGVFATSKDIPGQYKIRILSEKEDTGKEVSIKAITCDGEIVSLCFILKGDSWVETEDWVVGIKSIALPEAIGPITISANRETNAIEVIDEHSPTDPRVPDFRRFRLAMSCKACSIYVQASRRYRDLFFDNDIVEIGDRLVLEHGASYFKHSENTVDTAEINRGTLDIQTMNDLIRGMMGRERGGHSQDGPVLVRGRRTKRANLPGYNGQR